MKWQTIAKCIVLFVYAIRGLVTRACSGAACTDTIRDIGNGLRKCVAMPSKAIADLVGTRAVSANSR